VNEHWFLSKPCRHPKQSLREKRGFHQIRPARVAANVEIADNVTLREENRSQAYFDPQMVLFSSLRDKTFTKKTTFAATIKA